MNIKFVEEVEKHDILYKYNLPGYSRKDLTEKAWHEVAAKVNLTVIYHTIGLSPSTFGVPKEISSKVKWEKALGVTLRDKSRICQNHFKNEDILHTWVSGQGINKYTICLKCSKLCIDAVPIKFKLPEITCTPPVLINFEPIVGNVIPPDTNSKNENGIIDSMLPTTFDIISNIKKDQCYDSTYLYKKHPIENISSNDELLPSPKRIKV